LSFDEKKEGSNTDRKPQHQQGQGERKPYQKFNPTGEKKPFVKQHNTQSGENKQHFRTNKQQYNNQAGGSQQQQTQHNKRPYQKPKVGGTEQTVAQTSQQGLTGAAVAGAPKRTKKEADELLKEAQKLKELQKKIGKNNEETSTTSEEPLILDEDGTVIEDSETTQKNIAKRVLAEEIEKQEYLARLEGKKKKAPTFGVASTKKKGAKKKQRRRGEKEEDEEGSEYTRSATELQGRRREKEEEEEDVLKTDIELNEAYGERIGRIYTGVNSELLREQIAGVSSRGLLPSFAEMGAENGSNFGPLMKQVLFNNVVPGDSYHYLMKFISNYQVLSKKVVDSMEDKERAAEIREIYPFLVEQNPAQIPSDFDVNEYLNLHPEVRMHLVNLFDPDNFVNLEAVEAKAAKDLESMAKEGKLTSTILETYKQEISTKLLAEKLLNYFNSKLFSLQVAGVSDFFLQQETVEKLAETCYDNVVRLRGSAVAQYLPEEERNFIDERERALAMKYNITRENLHTFVTKDEIFQQSTFLSLNNRIEELLSKKRLNTIAIENKFKLEQPSEDFDHEDAYYYGDETNPQEGKKKRTHAVNTILADFKNLPLKSHVSAIKQRIKQRLYLLMRFVYEPKFDTIPYIRDVPFTSGQFYHAGKTGKFAKFAPIERSFDEIIDSNSEPDSIARLVLTNYSRALGQNESIDMKSKLALMHKFGSLVKNLDSQGDLMMPVALNAGRRTHFHPNRVNPRDAELDLTKIQVNEPEEHWFWRYMDETEEQVEKVLEKRQRQAAKISDIGRGGKPKVVKQRKK